jgi:hypothetical protein
MRTRMGPTLLVALALVMASCGGGGPGVRTLVARGWTRTATSLSRSTGRSGVSRVTKARQ